MSAIPTELRAGTARPRPQTSGLSSSAMVYFGVIALATIAASAGPISHLNLRTHGWTTFLVLAGMASVAQLFEVKTIRDQSYHTSIVFLVAAAILLPPELVALTAVVLHIPEWLKQRYAWYLQTFNICNYTLNALAAWGVAHLIIGPQGFTHHEARFALAGLAACFVLVLMNHVVLAVMLYLGRGHRPKETGLFAPAQLGTELVLAALGVGLASAWHLNPWLVPFALAPLLLIHRSLHVPRLEEQARVDSKTGLFNARHFANVLQDELSRAARFERPASLIMADLDLLREINNTYGHLAGDAVLASIAQVFKDQLRHYDVPARFGGEEFAILLPETPRDQALEIAERIRRAVASCPIDLDTASEPVNVTISMGVASFPNDGVDANELVHHADLAVYRAKLQGRNRVLPASEEPLLMRTTRAPRLVSLPAEDLSTPTVYATPTGRIAQPEPVVAPIAQERRQSARPAAQGPWFGSIPLRVGVLVGFVSVLGIAAGAAGLVFGSSRDLFGLLTLTGIVGIGQALALEVDQATISAGAVGALAGAALFGPRAALPIALAMAVVDWSAKRSPLHHVAFNVGALSLSSLAAAGMFSAGLNRYSEVFTLLMAVGAGAIYYLTNMALLSFAVALEGRERWLAVWHERFRWLLPHYIGYGVVAGVMAIAYHAAGLYALAVAVVPLLLMRKTQAAYLQHTQRSALKLREAAETIHSQNVSLEKANRLLRERSTAAMESLSATVDARDSYTAGHSRRVQRLALAIGQEIGLSQPELDLLGHAALFHDIGKLAIPDSILLKPARLDAAEWGLMKRHSDEGARIIDRLGFLEDAVPSIRHHHERFDGTGYPDHLRGDEIPLGARIIHVADALDSMLTTRTYRPALTAADALAELRDATGSQFCPRCVAALERILPDEEVEAAGLELLVAS